MIIGTIIKKVGIVGTGTILSAASFAGMASAQSSISDTGPFSVNTISTSSNQSFRSNNNNSIRLSNLNYQTAFTGSAFVSGNTNGHLHKRCHKHHNFNIGAGSARTGNASNFNQTSASVNVHNSTPSHGFVGGSGFAGGTISDTGPHSHNTITTSSNHSVTIRNSNNVTLTNRNTQTAVSGNATAANNTFGGSATTGSAVNTNRTNEAVAITNVTPALEFASRTGGSGASISDTGPFSTNRITTTSRSSFSETNNNNVNISNSNHQTAVSGNATVSGNTFGGSAVSGSVQNTNSTWQSVAISNN